MLRLSCLLLFALLWSSAPLAQVVGETNAILEFAGTQYAVFATQNYGAQFEEEVPFGPYEIIQAIDADGDGPDGDGTAIDGCSPFLNAEDVAGKIALISRGACTFVLKAENAANAGAVAYIVYMDGREGQEGETLVNMGGDCEPAVCSVPGVFLSRRDYKSIVTDPGFAEPATITVDFPDEPSFDFIDTKVVQLGIYDDGFIGGAVSFTGPGFSFPFVYSGFSPLFVATTLVGIDGNVAGSPYTGTSEYVRAGRAGSVTPIADDTFDEALQTAFRSPDLGVLVTLTARARTGDPFVFLQLAAANETADDLTEVYLGLFADWDIVDDVDDTSTNDLAAFDPDLGLAYIFDATRSQFYGVMPVLTDAYPGARLAGYGTDSDGTDEDLFAALAGVVPPAEGEGERAVVVGQGPYTLSADGTPVVQAFVLVPGLTEAELFANAEAARALFAVAAEEATQAGAYRLASVYPNPVATTATVGFTLPTGEEARVEVFDLLGRRMATLADGFRAAGEHRVTLDAVGLRSGVYVVRLSTARATLAERVTVVR